MDHLIVQKRRERWFLIILITIACLWSVAPYLYGFIMHPAHSQFSWIGFVSFSDIHVYYSYIRQITSGHHLLFDFYTLEPQAHGAFNVFWWLVGRFAGAWHLSPAAAFHFVKVAFIPGVVLLIYKISSAAFLSIRERMFATTLAIFGGGFGFFIHPPIVKEWPLDLATADGYPYLAFYYSPHFVVALLLFLGVMWFLFQALDTGRWRQIVFAGVLGFVLFQFHPYHILSLFVIVWGILFVWGALGRISWRRALGYGFCFFTITAPPIMYHGWLAFTDSLIAARHILNITPAPPVAITLASYGLFLIGLVIAIRVIVIAKRAPPFLLFVSLWALLGFSMLFSGLPYERRFTLGLTIPLALLCIEGLRRPWRRLFGVWKLQPLKVILILYGGLLLFFLTTAVNMVKSFVVYGDPPRSFIERITYLGEDRVRAFEWLARAPLGTKRVLAGSENSNVIPGRSGQQTFYGHWAETVQPAQKGEAVRAFFQETTSDAERVKFLKREKITHIFYSPYESALGTFNPNAADYLAPVFTAGDVTLYEVSDSAASPQ